MSTVSHTLARLDALYKLSKLLDSLILATPTSAFRNELTLTQMAVARQIQIIGELTKADIVGKE